MLDKRSKKELLEDDKKGWKRLLLR